MDNGKLVEDEFPGITGEISAAFQQEGTQVFTFIHTHICTKVLGHLRVGYTTYS